jgi:integrase
MGRQVRSHKLGSKNSRSKLKKRHDPYWQVIVPELYIGYRKGDRGGVWYGRQYHDGGYRKWRVGVADDIKDADGIEVLSFVQADEKVRRGPSGQASREMQTVNDAMAYYMENHGAATRSQKTTQYAIDKHIEPTIGRTRLSKLTVEIIRKWMNELAKSKGAKKGKDSTAREQKRRRQATANRVLTILKAALNYVERDGAYRGPAPWKLVSPFKHVDATEHPRLTRDEAVRLQNASPPDFRLLVRGALETGCRYGELASMKASDFNPDTGTITVREAKSGKVRHVHLTESGQTFFDEQVVSKKRTELIFLREDGKPWGKSHQQRPMREACKIAKIDPPVPFKALRTTYGSLLAMKGVPLQVTAAAMGHADTRITEKHYAHLMPSYQADTIRSNLPSFSNEKSNVERLKQK